MPFEKLKILLNEKIGLDPASIGDSSIRRALDYRIDMLNIKNYHDYYERLVTDSHEVKELVEEVTVPETWFFRNERPFEHFANLLCDRILPKRRKNTRVRILCVPCSTGEEPYSLAITLAERGVDLTEIEIDAIDVNQRHLNAANAAIYGKNAFRNTNKHLREKYFKKIGMKYQLIESIKKQVKFHKKNILMGSLSIHPRYYDVIFCRNLLIYFDKKNKIKAQKKLNRALKKSGTLFVGHAEPAFISEKYFISDKGKDSFSFEKTSVTLITEQRTLENRTNVDNENNPNSSGEWKKVYDQLADSISEKKYQAYGKRESSPSQNWIKRAIDSKDFENAEMLCKAFLRNRAESAQGHYLYALLKHQQKDNQGAETLLRKVLFLDPKHELALNLLAKIASNKGDDITANNYIQRAKKLRR